MTCLLEFARSILSFLMVGQASRLPSSRAGRPRPLMRPRTRNPASSPLFQTGQPSWMPTLHLNSLFQDSSRARPRENNKFRTHPPLLSPDGPCYSPAIVLLHRRQSDEGVGQRLRAIQIMTKRRRGIEHRRHHFQPWQRNTILIGSLGN
jgi:hypothetical protein